MTDAVHTYEFSEQAETGRPKLRMGLVIFAVAVGILCLAGVVFHEPLLEFAGSFLVPRPPSELDPDDVLPRGLSDDERLMYTMTHAGGEAGKQAIRDIVTKNDLRYASVLLEALIAGENNPPGYPWIGHHHYYKALMKLIGGPSMAPERMYQPLSQNFLIWYTASDLQSVPGYVGWKGQLLARIDPAFGQLFYEGVPTAVRLEEVRAQRSGFDIEPTLNDPRFIPAAEATFLMPDDPVVGIEIDGEARAYPDRIVQWHPVINDVIGKNAVTLFSGGLSGAAVAYDGHASDGKLYTFGASGLLYRTSELLFDHATHTVWCPLTGRPLFGDGVSLETRLRQVPIVTTTWDDWRSQFPQTTVLAAATGPDENLELGARWGEYFSSNEPIFAYGPRDGRLPPKSRVYGLQIGESNKAYPLADLAAQQVVNDTLGSEPLVLVCTRGTMPIEAHIRRVGRRGRSHTLTYQYDAGGEVRAYARQQHAFQPGPNPDALLDERGQTWRVTTNALVGGDGETLARINGLQAFWFAWSQHHVGTDVYGDPSPPAPPAETTP